MSNQLPEVPQDWDHLPDIDLYMDQVITYLRRQKPLCGQETEMTSAMINNYVKEGMFPRAKGKRYDKCHLARLLMIADLKQILNMKDLKELFSQINTLEDVKNLYGKYRGYYAEALQMAEGVTLKESPDDALRFALLSLVFRRLSEISLGCESKEKE